MTTTLVPPAATDDTARSPRFTRRTSDRLRFAALLAVTALAYLWNITVNGMGNQFYAAAAQAGSKNWEALLFGSLDTQNFMMVDKPPVSQWVMGLSGQIFGFSSASMLIPEALMAVATVALLYGAVRRISGPNAALLAGAALAVTPVAALMFRFNNPDAVMVLLMMAAVYCAVRALEHASARWIALAGAALGLAFLAKMLEGIMVAPAIGLCYLVAAPTSFRKRLLHLMGTLCALLVSSGWFVVVTLLWPASSRPYIAGSTDDNFMNLVLGYNGFGRVLGQNNHVFQQNPDIGAAAGAEFEINHGHHGFGFGDNPQGLTRMFTGEFGFEIGWLLPAALVALVFVVVSRGRAPRTDLVRAGAIVFGSWMLVDGLVLSYMKSMVHPYYSFSFAPAICGMLAIGVHEAWRRRDGWLGRVALVLMILGNGAWSWWLLGRNADWLPALRWVILAVTLASIVGLVLALTSDARRRFASAALMVGLVVGVLGGATAYSIATIGQPHEGGGPRVGPAQADGNPGKGWGQEADNPQLEALLRNTNTDFSAAIDRSNAAAGLELSTNTAVMAIGGFGGSDPAPTLSEFETDVANHRIGYYVAPSDDHRPGGFNGRDAHTDVTKWVAAHFTPMTFGSDTVYDLTAPPK